MKIEKAKNAKRNLIVGLFNRGVSLIIPFIMRNIMIQLLGAEYLGIDSLFTSILQVLNIAELGVSTAIVYSMYKPIAEDDIKTICALLNLFKIIYKIIGILILVIGFALMPFLPNFINTSPEIGGGIPGGINLYFVFFIYLINTFIGYFVLGYKTAIPNALQRVDIVTNVNTFVKFFLALSQIIILILLGKIDFPSRISYYLYLLIIPISTLVNNIILASLVNKYYPEFVCEGKVSKELKKQIKIKVSGLVINKICQTTRNSLDSICVSSFFGLTVTTMYNNYFYVISALTSIITIAVNSIIAGIGNSIVTESIDKNYSDFRRLNFIYMWISGWMTICCICLYQPFMQIWVGEKLMFPFAISVCFGIYFYVLRMGDLRGAYSDAVGLWWENRYRAIAESIMNIVLNIVLGKLLGVLGIILATIISLFFINFFLGSQIVFKYYFKNGKMREFFWDQIKFLLVTCFIGMITLTICYKVNILLGLGNYLEGSRNPMLSMLINICICIIITCFLYLLFYKKTILFKETMKWFLTKSQYGKYFIKFI